MIDRTKEISLERQFAESPYPSLPEYREFVTLLQAGFEATRRSAELLNPEMDRFRSSGSKFLENPQYQAISIYVGVSAQILNLTMALKTNIDFGHPVGAALTSRAALVSMVRLICLISVPAQSLQWLKGEILPLEDAISQMGDLYRQVYGSSGFDGIDRERVLDLMNILLAGNELLLSGKEGDTGIVLGRSFSAIESVKLSLSDGTKALQFLIAITPLFRENFKKIPTSMQ